MNTIPMQAAPPLQTASSRLWIAGSPSSSRRAQLRWYLMVDDAVAFRARLLRAFGRPLLAAWQIGRPTQRAFRW